MPLSVNTMRGLNRFLPGGAGRQGGAVQRLVIFPNTTAPVYGSHIRPTSAPSGAADKGDFYLGTDGVLYIHDGTSFVAQASATAGLFQTVQESQNQTAAASYAVSHTLFVNPNAGGSYRVAGVSAVFGTGSTSGTLQVEVATGTQAVGAGVNQLTGTIALSGTGNTVANGTLIASPTLIGAGARVNLIFAGTVTNLANASICVVLKKQ
jgi:hypothetical protein